MSDYLALPTVELVERWRNADEAAATELYRRYVTRLINLIGNKISPRMKARVSADDIIQSVFRTMFERVRRGEFRFDDEDRFWKLLVTIALNKWRNTIRHHETAGRSPERERGSLDGKATEQLLAARLNQRATVAESVIFADLLESLLEHAEEKEQRYILLRVQGGMTQEEIADNLGVSSRTVRRIQDRLYERASQLVGDAL